MAKDTTFIRVTNKDIYDAIQKGTEQNAKEHAEIVVHQLQTNGKVKRNYWVSSTALTLTIMAIGLCFKLL